MGRSGFMAFAQSKRPTFYKEHGRQPADISELVSYTSRFWSVLSSEEKTEWNRNSANYICGKGTSRKSAKRTARKDEGDEEYMSQGKFERKQSSDNWTTIMNYIVPLGEVSAAKRRLVLGARVFALLYITPRYAAKKYREYAPLEIACILFSFEDGIIEHNSWMLLPQISEDGEKDAKERAAWTNVPLDVFPDRGDFITEISQIAGELDGLMEEVHDPKFRLILGTRGVYNVTQGCLNWLRSELESQGNPEDVGEFLDSQGLLCVNSLVGELYKSLTSSSQPPKFPEWQAMVAKFTDPLESICCPYHHKYPPKKFRGCALASAKLIVNEMFEHLLGPLGLERSEDHSIGSGLKPKAVELCDTESWDDLLPVLEDELMTLDLGKKDEPCTSYASGPMRRPRTLRKAFCGCFVQIDGFQPRWSVGWQIARTNDRCRRKN